MPPGQVGHGVERQEAGDNPCRPDQCLAAKEDRRDVSPAQHDPGCENQDDRAAQGDRAVRRLQDTVDGRRAAAHRGFTKWQPGRERNLESGNTCYQHCRGNRRKLDGGHRSIQTIVSATAVTKRPMP